MGKIIDVVVVTYNRLPLLKECLESLLGQRENLSGIFVIDNHSTDGTTEYLAKIDDSLVAVPSVHLTFEHRNPNSLFSNLAFLINAEEAPIFGIVSSSIIQM